MIYILCPANYKSGGPEALHQLSYYMSKSGLTNTIVYVSKKIDNPTPRDYDKYGVQYIFISRLKDKKEDQIIFPEVYYNLAFGYKKAKVSIWWLSVDNFHLNKRKWNFNYKLRLTLKAVYWRNLNLIKSLFSSYDLKNYDSIKTHFVGSHYAEGFLRKMNLTPIKLLIEPIGVTFLKTHQLSFSSNQRSNRILYNPAKDKEIVPNLMRKYPDLEFVRLQNFSHLQLIELFKKSKLYVDFGHFPGPERLPKEAVAMGCCVVTSRKGAANYYEDVRIGNDYKIQDLSNTELIYQTIKKCLENYDSVIHDFEAYRTMVKDLEPNFKTSILAHFSQSK